MTSNDYSLLQLFLNASLAVQLVMLLLILLSILSWSYIFASWFKLRKVKKELAKFTARLKSGHSFDKLFEYAAAKKDYATGFEVILRNGFTEYAKLSVLSKDLDSSLGSAERSMFVQISKEQADLEKGLSFLATVGSISPYIGLLGTVIGIMASLRSLGMVAQATLSMVAPGISEALLATAMGLFVAIPAWFVYNRFTSHVQNIINNYQVLAEDCLVFLYSKFYKEHSNKNIDN